MFYTNKHENEKSYCCSKITASFTENFLAGPSNKSKKKKNLNENFHKIHVVYN